MLHRAREFLKASPLGILACCVFLVASIWVTFNTRRWNHREILQWDTDGYYLYLPAALIHHEPLDLSFLRSVSPGTFPPDYRFGQGAFFVDRTGHFTNKYTMGVAVSELPFFITAHAWCVAFSPEDADGYSPPYHLAVALASAFWACLGLLTSLRSLRQRGVSDRAAAVAVLGLGLGTNLFFYSSFAGGMSHPFLFFLCALLIERTDRWYRAPSTRMAGMIGLCIGLATLTRPTCVLFALIPLCWRVLDGGPGMLRAHPKHVLIALGLAAVCLLPQLIYWKVSAGSFLFWSYGEEGFDFRHPHVVDGLFGFRKGWFIYTPLALLGVAAAVGAGPPAAPASYRSMLLCFFLPFIYVTFSWDPWWYGGGFGSRPMIDALPLLALPLALLVGKVFAQGLVSRSAFVLVLTACLALNLFQQWQYQRGIIDCCAMTFERWMQVFGEPTSTGLPPFP